MQNASYTIRLQIQMQKKSTQKLKWDCEEKIGLKSIEMLLIKKFKRKKNKIWKRNWKWIIS